MSRSDVRHIKRLAERLGARDSDVIRFAIKLMLGKLAPLQDPSVKGRHLMPVFLESGPDLMRHFELDAARVSSIINDGVEPALCVEPDDIQLIALSGIQRSYLKLRVPAMLRRTAEGSNGSRSEDEPAAHGANGQRAAEGDSLEQSLRQYLYEKYLYPSTTGGAAHSGSGT